MTEQELEALSIDELEQRGYDLGRQRDAIREEMIVTRAVLSRKLNIQRLMAKLNAEELALLAGIVPIDAVAKVEPLTLDSTLPVPAATNE